MADAPENTETKQNKDIEFKRPGYQLVLTLTPDVDLCVASYNPVSGGAPLTRDELASYLGQLKIVEGIVPEALAVITAAAMQGKSIQGVTLAIGTPMIPGEPGRIALGDELLPAAVVAEPLVPVRTGDPQIVDFHQVQTFVNVGEGELIGKVLPPGRGTAGRSIQGSPILAREGKVFAVKLGKNVRYGDDGSCLYAEAPGRVNIHGEEISIEDIYQISGDVNFKTGNIDFYGYVEVRGDILDGFKVKAKGLRVQGNIGACQIHTEENLSFCGMSGQGRGTIVCGGTLTANFIYETTIESAGDLVVEAEIRSCQIQTLGAVRVKKGGISGGECVALAGVEASSLGSVTSLHTNIVAGANYRDLEELNKRFSDLKELIARFNATQKANLDPKQFQQDRVAITAHIQEIRSRTYPQTNAKVNVRKIIYGAVTVTLGVVSEEFREERPGPMSMIENTIEGGFRYLGMTDLALTAAEIEKSFVAQQQREAN